MKVWKLIDRNLEKWICGCMIALIVLVMLFQIVTRYIFNISMPWTEEFCRYCYIYFMFIGTALAIKEGSSLRVDALVTLLPQNVRKVILFVVDLFVLVVMCYLFYGSIPMVQELYRGGSWSAGLHLPVWIVYLACPVGLFLTILRQLQIMYRILKGNKRGGELC